MRIILLFLVLTIALYGEDWTTTDGKAYKDVKVIKVEDDAVTIMHSSGGALVPFSKLPIDLQKKFNYNPAKAKVAADARAESDRESEIALNAEREQAEQMKQAEHAKEDQKAMAAQPEKVRIQEEWEKSQAINKEDEANGYSHSSGRVIQVLPDGFIGSISTRWGIYEPGFVKCDSRDMVDGQTWSGIIIPSHTYQYTNGMGELATIPAFSIDLKETASEVPVSNYIDHTPRAPVSSTMAVGGG